MIPWGGSPKTQSYNSLWPPPVKTLLPALKNDHSLSRARAPRPAACTSKHTRVYVGRAHVRDTASPRVDTGPQRRVVKINTKPKSAPNERVTPVLPPRDSFEHLTAELDPLNGNKHIRVDCARGATLSCRSRRCSDARTANIHLLRVQFCTVAFDDVLKKMQFHSFESWHQHISLTFPLANHQPRLVQLTDWQQANAKHPPRIEIGFYLPLCSSLPSCLSVWLSYFTLDDKINPHADDKNYPECHAAEVLANTAGLKSPQPRRKANCCLGSTKSTGNKSTVLWRALTSAFVSCVSVLIFGWSLLFVKFCTHLYFRFFKMIWFV